MSTRASAASAASLESARSLRGLRRRPALSKAVLETLEARQLLSADTIATFLDRSANIGNYFTNKMTAQARIGDLGGNGTYETNVGFDTSAPYVRDQKNFAWSSDTWYDFTLVYKPSAQQFSFTVDSVTSTFDPTATVPSNYVWNAGKADAISIRARSTSNSTIDLDHLSLALGSGSAVDVPAVSGTGQASISSETNGNKTLLIKVDDLQAGMTLSGRIKMSWTGTRPTNSNLATQISLGNVSSQLPASSPGRHPQRTEPPELGPGPAWQLELHYQWHQFRGDPRPRCGQ